jgi:hypothetical protein
MPAVRRQLRRRLLQRQQQAGGHRAEPRPGRRRRQPPRLLAVRRQLRCRVLLKRTICLWVLLEAASIYLALIDNMHSFERMSREHESANIEASLVLCCRLLLACPL